MCTSVYPCGRKCPRRPEVPDTHGAGVPGSCGHWDENSSPLTNPYALLPSEPFLPCRELFTLK